MRGGAFFDPARRYNPIEELKRARTSSGTTATTARGGGWRRSGGGEVPTADFPYTSHRFLHLHAAKAAARSTAALPRGSWIPRRRRRSLAAEQPGRSRPALVLRTHSRSRFLRHASSLELRRDASCAPAARREGRAQLAREEPLSALFLRKLYAAPRAAGSGPAASAASIVRARRRPPRHVRRRRGRPRRRRRRGDDDAAAAGGGARCHCEGGGGGGGGGEEDGDAPLRRRRRARRLEQPLDRSAPPSTHRAGGGTRATLTLSAGRAAAAGAHAAAGRRGGARAGRVPQLLPPAEAPPAAER